MQTILSPEQRLEAYESILGELKSAGHIMKDGLCTTLSDFSHVNFGVTFSAHEACDYFPELEKHKPEGKKCGELWFLLSREGRAARIKICESCIEEVKGLIGTSSNKE